MTEQNANLLPTIKVTRNGIEKTFVEEVVGKKSKENAGKHFPAPEIKLEWEEREIDGQKFYVLPVNNDLAWIGLSDVCSLVQGKLRTASLSSWIDNTSDDGKVDIEAYIADMAGELGAKENLSDIEDQIDAMQEQQQQLLLSAEASSDMENTMNKIRELAQKIKPLKEKAAAISAIYQERAAKRKETKERKALEEAAKKANAALNQSVPATA